MRLAALALAGLLLALHGCGHKGGVLAPELVRPEPPTELDASATAEGVRLTWTRPSKYTGGQRMHDLAGFEIERTDADAEPLRFVRVGTVDLQDQARFRQQQRIEWVDKDAAPEKDYIYRVRAHTTDGYDSPWARPVLVRAEPAGAGKKTEPAP